MAPERDGRTGGRRALLGLALAAAGAAGLAPMAGCNIVGPAFILIHGPEKIPPMYKLDPNRPTVVFIDDPASRVPRRQLRLVMGQAIDKALLSKGLIKSNEKANNLIDSSAVQTVASNDKSESPMSITQIGKAVGAEVVVWFMVDQFTLSTDGQSFAPTVSVRLKIIDTVADKRLWPEDPRGDPQKFTYPASTATTPTTTAERAKAEMALAEFAAKAMGELFYEVEKPLSARAGNK